MAARSIVLLGAWPRSHETVDRIGRSTRTDHQRIAGRRAEADGAAASGACRGQGERTVDHGSAGIGVRAAECDGAIGDHGDHAGAELRSGLVGDPAGDGLVGQREAATALDEYAIARGAAAAAIVPPVALNVPPWATNTAPPAGVPPLAKVAVEGDLVGGDRRIRGDIQRAAARWTVRPCRPAPSWRPATSLKW